MTRGSSVSSLKSGKASIQYPPPKTKCNPHQQENSNDATSDVASTTAPPPSPDVTPTTAIITNTAAVSLSESVQPISSTDTQQPPSSSQHPRISTSSPEPMNEINHDETNNSNHVIPNDDEIIAEIIAKATAVSKASGQYSSLSSGRASIAKTRSSDSSPPPIMTQSLSESSSRPASIRSIDNHRSSTSHPRNSMSSSIFSKLVTGGSNNKKKPIKDDEKARQELAEAGIEVKEIKSTLGRMVVPDDVVNPMPKITLEKPQYARVNR